MSIRWYGPSIVLLLTVATVMLVGPGLARRMIWTQQEAQITQVRQELIEDQSLAAISTSFSKVSQVVEPSVVHIQTYAASATSGGGMFSRFDPLDPLGNGSGWVYRHTFTPAPGSEPGSNAGKSKNYILTNHHVVEGAARIRVRFADGSEHTARLVNSDPPTDVAVLEVDDAFLHPAELSPDPVSKGHIVFAFGSPLRFDFSVSQGIVSASGRQLDIERTGKYEDFIQTDAAINPGNSGGPLTDIYGRVVGMNTAIASTRSNGPNDPGGFMGLGFAIPVDMAVEVATRIIEDGQVRRGYLGVLLQLEDLTPELAASFGYDDTAGVLIEHAIGGGPADEAGLTSGDIITRVEGQPIADADALRYVVAGYDPGHKLRLTAVRGGKAKTFDVELAELPPQARGGSSSSVFEFQPVVTQVDPKLRAWGIERVADFTEADATDLGFAPLAGVMVIDVRFGSIAFPNPRDARVRRQSIITHLGDTRVQTVQQLQDALRDHDPWAPARLTTVTWNPEFGEYVTRYALLRVQRD